VQADSEYRRNLQSFERGLRQRNKLLDLIHDGRASRSQLIFWDQLLISTGSFITEKRQMYIEYVNKIVLDNFHYKLMYDKSIISESRLLQYKDEEVAAKTTLVGPQRDDFTILKPTSSDFLNRKTPTDPLEEQDPYHDVARFGSRGEQRLAVLWLKLAELSFIQQETGERPILLLDDIFSELDEKSRDIVLSIIYKQQTVITSAEEDVKELFGNDKDVGVITLPMQ
jgi:DNA replication and repair protein RecF